MQPTGTASLETTSLPDFEGLERLSLLVGQEDVLAGADDVRVGMDSAAAVAVVQLNRPARRNALTQGMIDRLVALLAQLDRNDAVRAVVLMGTRKGAFSGLSISTVFRKPNHVQFKVC